MLHLQSSDEDFMACLRAAQQGDQKSRDLIGERLSSLVLSIAHRGKFRHYLQEDAEGIAAIAFTKAMDAFPGSGRQNFEAYVSRTIFQALNEEMAKNFRRCQKETFVEEDCDNDKSYYDLDCSEEYLLKEVWAILPKDCVKAFTMFWLNGHTVTHIANELGISRRTASERVNRARKILLKKWFL